jgi:lytic cellulose monooxygenase (C1-hydroxylating)
MFLTFATVALALASTASAHATIYGVSVNGKDLGDGRNKFIRSPQANVDAPHKEYNSPIKDITSPDLVCNVRGGESAPEFVKAAAGDKLAIQWYHHKPNDPSDYPLADTHLGSIVTYIAAYKDGNPTGPIWSKIHQAGYENGQWATIKLIANGGKVEFSLPKSLKKGKYLVRQEIIALHQADFRPDEDPDRGAEFYPGCVQVDVTEGGDAVPDQNFDINTGYKYTDPGLDFNVHYPEVPYESYKPPGPKVWSG